MTGISLVLPADLATCISTHGSLDSGMRSLTGDSRSTSGLDAVLATIASVVTDAVEKHPATRGQPLSAIAFRKIWVGMAGYDRQVLMPLINNAISNLFCSSPKAGLRISSDIDLLPAALASYADIASIIVLVVGTGSVAMNYQRNGRSFRRTGRLGGWGKVFGDDGSGYAIGREGIRATLRHCDLHNLTSNGDDKKPAFGALPQAILAHFQQSAPGIGPDSLLDHLLVPEPAQGESTDIARTKAIASAASVVLSVASKDPEAGRIAQSGAIDVAALVRTLVAAQHVDVARCALVLGGGLMANLMYREAICGMISEDCGEFSQVRTISEPAIAGAEYLVNER